MKFMAHAQKINKQSGFVSLFTVIFFTLLITVVTVGFISIVIKEQQQSLNNDLTASALNAAESGIEDAKRVILAYFNMPSGAAKTALFNDLTSSQCSALTNDPTAQSLGVATNGSVTGQANLNQYYTCLTVNLFSPNYLASSAAGTSVFIPLVAQSNFDQLVVSWHLVSNTVGTDGDGRPSKYVTTPTTLPQVSGAGTSWSANGYPAYLRVQLYGYPNGNFVRSDINDRTRSIFLVPSSVGGTAASFDTADPLPHQFDTGKNAPQAVKCVATPATVPVGTYACSTTISLPAGAAFSTASNSYFLRVTPLYGSTHFSVALRDSSTGNTVNFNGVQPVIDVTGKASDVYRRVQARVVLGNISNLPEFAAESAGDICKNMVISDGSYFQPNNCP
jgi:Tfp pilus assembly protein PilX